MNGEKNQSEAASTGVPTLQAARPAPPQGETSAEPDIAADEACQQRLLPGVSRTFALTIPELPGALRGVVTNAYLLCRIADTIEDDAALSPQRKHELHEEFVEVLAGKRAAETFSATLTPLLSEGTLQAERELVAELPRVVRVMHRFNPRQRRALEQCVATMCHGMPRFQQGKSLRGLADLEELDLYCYYVAGVVGEMLTELFCDYSPAIAERRAGLSELSTRFGQGLQMTNILKDVWEDRRTNTCWLPRDVFRSRGFDLDELAPGRYNEAFGAGMEQLIGVAHAHLRHALEYTLLIPPQERGVRRFCVWAIGLAVLTLRKIHRNPEFTAGKQVKIKRATVKATVFVSNLAVHNDAALTLLFQLATRGLPLASPDAATPATVSKVA